MSKKYGFGMKSVLLAVGVVAVLNACAMAPGSGVETPGAADASAEVKVLAQSRWDALIRGDVTTAYSYLSPASKASVSLLQYQQRLRLGLWKRVEIEAVSCEPEVCKVVVKMTYDYKQVKGVETPLNEAWVKEGGRWWFVLKK